MWLGCRGWPWPLNWAALQASPHMTHWPLEASCEPAGCAPIACSAPVGTTSKKSGGSNHNGELDRGMSHYQEAGFLTLSSTVYPASSSLPQRV